MRQDTQDEALNTIIKILHLNKPMDPNLIEQLQFVRQDDISAYLGLINVLYTIVQEEFSANNQSEEMVEQNRMKERKTYKGSDILKIRGSILREYVKLLHHVLPDPAYFIARFDYEELNKFCVKRSVPYLLRHTRGIYPEIDTIQTPLLPFLPFYNDTLNSEALVGNINSRAARRTVELFYNSEVKTGHIFKQEKMQQENDSKQNIINLRQDSSTQSDQKQLRNGVRLSYIMILEKADEMENYIRNLRQFVENNSENEQLMRRDSEVIDRFQFWYRNYKSFIHEGMSMYERREDSILFPLIYAADGNSLEQNIIQLIKLVLDLKQKGQSEQLMLKIDQKIASLVNFAKDEKIIPYYEDSFRDNNRYLVLAFIHSISQILFKNRVEKTQAFIAYQELCSFSDPIEQPYNRVFYDDRSLIELYESGKIKQFPTQYFFHELDLPILRAICQKNPDQLVVNLDRLVIMSSSQRLRILVKNRLIGSLEDFDQESTKQSLGEQIISYLEMHINQFFQDLVDNQGKQLDKKTIKNCFNSFIVEWKDYYQNLRNFTAQSMNKFLHDYETLSQKGSILPKSNTPNAQQKVMVQQLAYPMSRPDVIFNITSKFTNYLDSLNNQYLSILQKLGNKDRDYKSDHELANRRKDLAELLRIFQKEQFKQMLEDSNPNFLIDSQEGREEGVSSQQEELQDYAWKVYARVYLSLGEYCKNLIEEADDGMDIQDS